MLFRIIVFLSVFLLQAVSLFAADPLVPAGMQTLANNVLEIFTSDIIKIVLMCILCGAAIAFAYNKDNEKIKRTCIVVAISTGILIAAQTIINTIWSNAGGS